MDPPLNRYTVVEGTDVRLTCYIRNNDSISNAVWKIESSFVAKTVANSSSCRVVYGPNNFYAGKTTTASCNQTSSSLMIANFTAVEAKNWSCSYGEQRVHILLVTQRDSSDLPTPPPTTDVPRGLETASDAGYQQPTTDGNHKLTMILDSSDLPTPPPTTDVLRGLETASDAGYQQPTTDGNHNLTMIYSLTAGGILVLVLVLVLVCLLKVRISRRDRVSVRERMRSDSSPSLAEMAENPVYETSGNVTAVEPRHDVSVTNGGRPENVEISDLYAKIQKSRGRDAEASAQPDNSTQS
ncbi:uncharacterized protein [Haliotis asinina]